MVVAVPNAEAIRALFADKLFSTTGVNAWLAETVTLKSENSPTYNSRGEEEVSSFTESTVTVVFSDMVKDRRAIESFGLHYTGNMEVYLPYDTTLSQNAIIDRSNGDSWRVIEHEETPGNLIKIARVEKIT